METVIKYIASSFAGVAAIALVLSTVINYADIVSGIYSLFRKAFDFRNAIEKIYYKNALRVFLEVLK